MMQHQQGETPSLARAWMSGTPSSAAPMAARPGSAAGTRPAQGLSNQEIADRLVVGEATVRSHVSSILRKLQPASRTQAALYALREGLATLDEGGAAD